MATLEVLAVATMLFVSVYSAEEGQRMKNDDEYIKVSGLSNKQVGNYNNYLR